MCSPQACLKNLQMMIKAKKHHLDMILFIFGFFVAFNLFQLSFMSNSSETVLFYEFEGFEELDPTDIRRPFLHPRVLHTV